VEVTIILSTWLHRLYEPSSSKSGLFNGKMYIKMNVCDKKGVLYMNLEPWMIVSGVILLVLIVIYNRLVFLRNKVKETFKNIDVYLEQRFNTLTKLAQTVAGYSEHEKEIHITISKLRRGYSVQSDDEKVRRSNEAARLVNGFTIERYPDLKASKNFLQLQQTVNHLEEMISASKRTYNARVNQYNTWTQRFPIVLFARLLGFPKKEFLQIEEYKKRDVDLYKMLRG